MHADLTAFLGEAPEGEPTRWERLREVFEKLRLVLEMPALGLDGTDDLLEQLEQRHSRWRPDGFSAMPTDLTPFGADRIAGSVVEWAQNGLQELLPAGLDLGSLDRPALQALASWFVMRAMADARGSGRTTSAGRTRRRKVSDPNVIQLSLLDQA